MEATNTILVNDLQDKIINKINKRLSIHPHNVLSLPNTFSANIFDNIVVILGIKKDGTLVTQQKTEIIAKLGHMSIWDLAELADTLTKKRNI